MTSKSALKWTRPYRYYCTDMAFSIAHVLYCIHQFVIAVADIGLNYDLLPRCFIVYHMQWT